MPQVIECLPNKPETLSSNHISIKKKERKKKKIKLLLFNLDEFWNKTG
jgi:hypothetical protein